MVTPLPDQGQSYPYLVHLFLRHEKKGNIQGAPPAQPGVLDLSTAGIGAGKFPVAALCTAGCVASPLTSAHSMPAAPPPLVTTKNVSRHDQMSPGKQTAPG